MDIKYIEPSKVEQGIRDRVYDTLTKEGVIPKMIEDGKCTITVRHGEKIDNYDSGFIDVIPLKYKGKTSFRVEYTLYDYSLYDTHCPYARAIRGSYLLDGQARLLAISESTTLERDIENFPWTSATNKAGTSGIARIIQAPNEFIDSVGQPIKIGENKPKSKNPIKYIRQVLDTKKQTQEDKKNLAHEIHDFANKYAAQSRSLKYIDEDIQHKVRFMENLIDSVLNDTPISGDVEGIDFL